MQQAINQTAYETSNCCPFLHSLFCLSTALRLCISAAKALDILHTFSGESRRNHQEKTALSLWD